jgi:hypothetical protein
VVPILGYTEDNGVSLFLGELELILATTEEHQQELFSYDFVGLRLPTQPEAEDP